MGKRKFKSSETTITTDTGGEFEYPEFNENALSALTSRIKKDLTKQNQLSKHVKRAATEIHNVKLNSNIHKIRESSSKIFDRRNKALRLIKKENQNGENLIKDFREVTGRNSNSSKQKDYNNISQNGLLSRENQIFAETKDKYELVEKKKFDSKDEKLPKSPIQFKKTARREPTKLVNDTGPRRVTEESSNKLFNNTAVNKSQKEISRLVFSDSTNVGEKYNSVNNTTSLSPSPSKSSNSFKRLIFEIRPDWHETPLPSLPTYEVGNKQKFNHSIAKLKEYATKLLETDNQLYALNHLSSSSSKRFLSTIMTSGTLSDKVSALTLVVQESPVHNVKAFENLLGIAKKRSRGQAVIALAALKDLLGTGTILPVNRRLRSFENQPGLLSTLSENSALNWTYGQALPGNISKVHLVYWTYEDWLKRSYFEMLRIIENWCNDEIEYARSRVIGYVYELLRDKPEQESNLLRLLVNKLGDPERKIASRTSYLILQLQNSHPLMKPIILRSIETEILLRSGQSIHAKYYAVTTLNQTILSSRETEIARSLLRIYFELFVSILKKNESLKSTSHTPETNINRKRDVQRGRFSRGKRLKVKMKKEHGSKLDNEEENQKMISAILTGVNRAFPFAKSDDYLLENQMNTLFKITHSSNFNTSIQALMLIEKLATTKNLSVDRFYRTLYESLFDPRLVTSSKHTLYLNLLYRALRSDSDILRVKAFAKRMVQVISLHQPPFICGILYILMELKTKFPGIGNLITDPEEGESDEEKYFDVPENDISAEAHKSIKIPCSKAKYDGRKRDPRHSNVDNSCLWELIPFTTHFHPSVSLFAIRLLNGEKMPPKPDLVSHSLSSFLDRFIYRNPKSTTAKAKGNSIMQPLAGGDGKSIFLSQKHFDSSQIPVNNKDFWQKKIEDIPVDKVFFHKYFSGIEKSNKSSRTIKDKTKNHDKSDEDEDKVWQALVRSKPDIEGHESDSDIPSFDDSTGESVCWESESDNGKQEILDFSTFEYEQEVNSGDADPEIDNLFEQESKTDCQKQSNDLMTKGKRKRIKIKNLPTFASIDDYAHMLEDNQAEDY